MFAQPQSGIGEIMKNKKSLLGKEKFLLVKPNNEKKFLIFEKIKDF